MEDKKVSETKTSEEMEKMIHILMKKRSYQNKVLKKLLDALEKKDTKEPSVDV